jgi:uncharacterized protein (UPF0303 family)
VTQETLLRQREADLETLRIVSFNFDDALAIGLDLVETAGQKAQPVVLDLTVIETIAVSCLPDAEDYETAVAAIRIHVERIP